VLAAGQTGNDATGIPIANTRKAAGRRLSNSMDLKVCRKKSTPTPITSDGQCASLGLRTHMSASRSKMLLVDTGENPRMA
jgi:hypothetical protein